jgi:V/A-type H+-transporting ATPase subunit I
MVRLLAVVLEHDSEKVTDVLLRKGVMHFMDVHQVKDQWEDKVQKIDQDVSLTNITGTRKRIEGMLKSAGYTPGDTVELIPPDGTELAVIKTSELEEDSKNLEKISSELNRIKERQRSVQQQLSSLTEIKEQMSSYGVDLPDTGLSARYSFISIRMGQIDTEHVKSLNVELGQIPSVVIPLSQENELSHLLLVAMKRDNERVDLILKKLGWREVKLSPELGELRSEVAVDLDSKMKILEEEYSKLNEQKRRIIEGTRKELDRMWNQFRVHELFSRVQNYFRKTSRTVVFSGWLPENKRMDLEEGIKHVTQGHCYLEWSEPKDLSKRNRVRSKPPVQFKNPKFFAPFQMLVKNYAVPEYGTVDPTFFVMFTYLIMFGLMFSDVGQGAVLVLIGLWSSILFKGKREGLRNLSKLITWCGASSIIFGGLFGSYFGMEWVKPIWFDFHGIVVGNPNKQSYIKDLFDILTISLYFGITVISVGLLFNWINLTIKRKWGNLILDKGGLMGGWIFGGGIYTAMYLIQHGYKRLPAGLDLFILVGTPAIFLFLKPAILGIIERKEKPHEPFTVFVIFNLLMEGIVELLEVFSGYLSNTLSFLRVAGFGIAHVSLMTAFFELARMASAGSVLQFSIWSILILVVGNFLVIGLEGLSAGIQSLRLNYYEFFTKFFSGSGELYSPVSLRKMREEA